MFVVFQCCITRYFEPIFIKPFYMRTLVVNGLKLDVKINVDTVQSEQ